MRKGRLLGIGLLGVASWLAMPAAHAAVTKTHADLSGAPEGSYSGDPDGKGTADVDLDDEKNEVCYTLKYENITGPPTAAHIHAGAKGVSGPPVVTLDKGDSGCVKANPSDIKAIRDNPANFYVNIHTSDYGKGAIRGQLAKV